MKKICVVEDFRVNVLKETSFVKSDDGHAISRQEKRWLPKEPHVFPPRKKWHYPSPVGLPWDSPPPPPENVRTYGHTYADVRTKISQIGNWVTRFAYPWYQICFPAKELC